MRLNYFLRTLAKSLALLVTIIFIIAIIYDTSSKAKEELEKTGWEPLVNKVHKSAPAQTQLEIFRNKFLELKALKDKKTESELSNGESYLSSNEIEESTKSEDYQKILQFNTRFWDVAVPSDQNAVIQKKNTNPVMYDSLDNLWRPVKGQIDVKGNDRIVPQLVWQMEAANSSYSKRFKEKSILVYDTFEWWHKPNFRGEGLKKLQQSDCHHNPNSLLECTFTDDVSKLDSVDAIITARDSFHTQDVSVPEKVLKFNFILESPFHSAAYLTRTEDLLATYWRGSDVVTPYSKWVYYDLNKKLQPQSKDYTIGKTKAAAIFVSNCDAWNDRIGYVRELQKFIEVDMYGHCGPLRCDRANEKTCFQKLKSDYFFYLSFENSNCRDYITEKLYTNGLGNDVVPIVMGAHPDDVQAVVPYKSYIHIEEFDEPAELGAYMKFLMENPKEYNKYFEWKGTGEFVETELFCRICAMVHYADLLPPPKREKKFGWGHRSAISDGMCLKRGMWYWTKPNKKSPDTPKRSNRHPERAQQKIM